MYGVRDMDTAADGGKMHDQDVGSDKLKMMMLMQIARCGGYIGARALPDWESRRARFRDPGSEDGVCGSTGVRARE